MPASGLVAALCGWFQTLGTGDKIAAVATAVGFLQFVVLVATVHVMRRSARQQLRGYVSAFPDFIRSFDEQTLAEISFTTRNVGQTPAYDITHSSDIEVLPQPLPPGYRFPEPTGDRSTPTVLFPGRDFNGTKRAARTFSVDEILRIRNDEARIYIWGEIRYRDAFNKKRWTRFAANVSADRDTLDSLTSRYGPRDLKVTFNHAPTWNDADR